MQVFIHVSLGCLKSTCHNRVDAASFQLFNFPSPLSRHISANSRGTNRVVRWRFTREKTVRTRTGGRNEIRTWIERGDRKASLVAFSSIGPVQALQVHRSLGANHSLNVPRCTCLVASFIAFISLLCPGTPFVASPWLIIVSFSLSPTTLYLLAHHVRPFAFHARSIGSTPGQSRSILSTLFSSRSILHRPFASRTTDNVTEIPDFGFERSASSLPDLDSFTGSSTRAEQRPRGLEIDAQPRNTNGRKEQVQKKIRTGLGYRLQSSASADPLQAWAASRRHCWGKFTNDKRAGGARAWTSVTSFSAKDESDLCETDKKDLSPAERGTDRPIDVRRNLATICCPSFLPSFCSIVTLQGYN